MTQTGRYHGGLVFFGEQDSSIDRYCRIVTATLEDYGHPVERQSILSQSEARITASRYAVKLKLGPLQRVPGAAGEDAADITRVAEEARPRMRLELELCPVDAILDDTDQSQLLVVVMLFRMVDTFGAEHIEWLTPETVIPRDRFLGLFRGASPLQVHGRREGPGDTDERFAPVDETEAGLTDRFETLTIDRAPAGQAGSIAVSDDEALAMAFRSDAPADEVAADTAEDDAENDIRRLASWGMTGVVGFMCAPVAVSLAAVNLARGEDFRLNTHVLSLTGFLVVIQSSGALASVVAQLPI